MIGDPTLEQVLAHGIPGDLIETGVWRERRGDIHAPHPDAHDVTDRLVWVADSFAGLHPPDHARYPRESALEFHTMADLVVSLDDVRITLRGTACSRIRFAL